MAKKKKKVLENSIKTRVPLRLHRPEKTLFQAHVDAELLKVLRPVLREHRMMLRDVVEWGMREFLAHVAPDQARALRIDMRTP